MGNVVGNENKVITRRFYNNYTTTIKKHVFIFSTESVFGFLKILVFDFIFIFYFDFNTQKKHITNYIYNYKYDYI